LRIAVTGAAGFVGSHLTEALLQKGHSVIGLDQSRATIGDRIANHQAFTFQTGDIRDESFVSAAIGIDCELIFHLAAVVGVTNYLTSPFDVVDVNVLGTRNALMAAQAANSRFVLASTSEIYGKNPKVPWSEDDDRILGGTQVDRWSYSSSKAAAEHLTRAAGDRFDIPFTIVRFFNAYGPGQKPIYVISNSIHRVLNGKPPLVYDSGDQTRCFTYIADVVDGTIRAGTDPAGVGEVFNIGSSAETSIRSAIETVIAEAGAPDLLQAFSTKETFGRTYQDITRRIPDVTKAKSLLGWAASTSLRDGVRLTIDWARSHPSWLDEARNDASEPTTTSISS
jgi:UDP-glucose 4-epimerase